MNDMFAGICVDTDHLPNMSSVFLKSNVASLERAEA